MLWCIAIGGVNSRCTVPTSEFDPKQKYTTTATRGESYADPHKNP